MNRQFRRSCQSGFSLLEVLITLVIIAIGMMGFAAMMLNSMKNNRTAMERSIATFYAYDIIDCMRANRAGVPNGYDIDFGETPSGTTVADDDLTLWKNALSNLLPSGDGEISFSGNTVTVKIQWAGASRPWETESSL